MALHLIPKTQLEEVVRLKRIFGGFDGHNASFRIKNAHLKRLQKDIEAHSRREIERAGGFSRRAWKNLERAKRNVISYLNQTNGVLLSEHLIAIGLAHREMNDPTFLVRDFYEGARLGSGDVVIRDPYTEEIYTPPSFSWWHTKAFLDILNSPILLKKNPTTEEILERAFLFHIWFIYLHPFKDGNGRTGRTVMNLLLEYRGFPPAGILDRKKYFEHFGYIREDFDEYLRPLLNDLYLYQRHSLSSEDYLEVLQMIYVEGAKVGSVVKMMGFLTEGLIASLKEIIKRMRNA